MHIQVFHLLPDWNKSHCIHHWRTYLHLIMSGLLQKLFIPRGRNHTLYLTAILSHNYSFVTSLTYILIYELYVQKNHFSKWKKIHLNSINHFLSTRCDRFKFKIIVVIYSTEFYIISNIPSTIILILIPILHNLSRSLHFSSFFRYLNLSQDLMKCYVIVPFKALASLAMTILIIFSSPLWRSFTIGIDWSITLRAYHRLYPLRTIYLSFCSLIKILGQQIHLWNYLQHFWNELSFELQVHIFLTRI